MHFPSVRRKIFHSNDQTTKANREIWIVSYAGRHDIILFPSFYLQALLYRKPDVPVPELESIPGIHSLAGNYMDNDPPKPA